MVDIQVCIYGYYLMFGLYPQSMKYFTALNEPHEEAQRKRGIILLHQSLFTLRCQLGVVHSLPPSTHSSIHWLGTQMLPNLYTSTVLKDFTKWHLKLKGRQPHQSGIPSLFIPVAAMGKCKQINNFNLQYGSNPVNTIST